MRPAQYWAAWSKWQKLEQHTREWLKWLSQALAYDQLAQWVREKRLGFVQWNDEKRKYGWKKAYHPMFWDNRETTKLSTWKWGRKTQFLLISGPNASGKTTFLKMATYLHWMGQAWGVTTAKEAKLPWIHTFWSWIRVPDQTGQESLFEAEVKRARELLDEMKIRTERGERVWIWMDEVLSSTNWEESAATCYATLKQLVGKDSLVWGGCTTHIGALEELERKTHRKIQCVHFQMENNENSLKPTYEIKKGMSHQNLALSWIRQNGMLKGNEEWDGDASWMVEKMRSQGAVQ